MIFFPATFRQPKLSLQTKRQRDEMPRCQFLCGRRSRNHRGRLASRNRARYPFFGRGIDVLENPFTECSVVFETCRFRACPWHVIHLHLHSRPREPFSRHSELSGLTGFFPCIRIVNRPSGGPNLFLGSKWMRDWTVKLR